jgi:hypothetical protein
MTTINSIVLGCATANRNDRNNLERKEWRLVSALDPANPRDYFRSYQTTMTSSRKTARFDFPEGSGADVNTVLLVYIPRDAPGIC